MVTASLLRYYSRLQRRHPTILWRGDPSRREIALTFDDGPHARDTPRLLDVLEKHEIRATFHLLGKHAEEHFHLVRQIHERGHQPALHGYRHVPFPLENLSVLHGQLERARKSIGEACGIPPETIRDLRPPYGAYNRQTLAHMEKWGYRLVMWSCIPPHWMQPLGWSIRQVLEAIVPGVVIVLHDGHGHGSRVAEIVESIVPPIQSLGYGFVTVEEMQTYRNRQVWQE